MTGKKEKNTLKEMAEQKLPAIFSNRFNIGLNANHTRIIFGDAIIGMDAEYHTSIVMPTEDAKELAQLILQLIEKNKEFKKITKNLV